MPLDNKISNIIGVRIPEWVYQQLQTRSQKNSLESRDNDNLLYLGNKTAWVRMISSVDITDERDQRYFSNLGADILFGGDKHTDKSLAQEFTLFGGVSRYLTEGQSYLRSGLKKGGSYGILGDSEVQKYGYRPMPGITSVNIETQGRLGSVRSATVNFKCWDKDQLDIIDALYFKLGFSMLLEWGHTYYYPNGANKVESTEFITVDPFLPGLTKEEILRRISKNSRASQGNYDAMLGIVTNFNFSFNQEGGYDCTVKLISLGGLGDSVKINNPNNFSNILEENIKEYNNILEQIARKKEGEKNKNQLLNPTITQISEDEKFRRLLRSSQNNPNSVLGLTSDESNPAQNIVLNANQKGSFLYVKKINKLLPLDLDQNISVSFNQIFLNNIFSNKNINLDYDLKVRTTKNWQDNATSAKFVPQTIRPAVFGFSLNKNYSSKKVKEGFNFNIWRSKKLVFSSIPDGVTQIIENQLASKNLNPGDGGYNFQALQVPDLSDRVKSSILINDEIASSAIGATLGFYEENGTLINEEAFKTFGELFKKTISTPNATFSVVRIEPIKIQDRTGLGVTSPQVNKYIITVKVDVPIKLPGTIKVSNITNSSFQKVPDRNFNTDLNWNIESYFQFEDTLFIEDIFSSFIQPVLTVANENQSQDQSSDQDPNPNSTKSPLSYLSSLELILRTIQVHSLSEAIKQSGNQLDIGNEVQKIEFYKNKEFVKELFSNGIFSTYVLDLVSGSVPNIDDRNYDKETDQSAYSRDKVHAKYGFATNLMANKEPLYSETGNRNFTPVNFQELLTSYVVPYRINQEIELGAELNHPVYISLGSFLMVMNHSSTIYDVNQDASQQRPLIYLDFNPNHNFCLSNPSQLSTDPLTCLIRFEGEDKDYENLFDQKILTEDRTSIQALSGSTQTTTLFTPNSDVEEKRDNLSGGIPAFKYSDGKNINPYRARVMNVMLSIDYLMRIIRNFSTKNDENKVFLKPLLDQIIIDICKSTGNFNILRVSYNDSANTYQIIDDQIVPVSDNEIQLNSRFDSLAPANNNATLPLFGKNTIAKSLEIKTDVSTKLNNLLAISANANPQSKSSLSSNGDSFGFINTNYVDRYINNKQEVSSSNNEPSDGEKNAAIQFNSAIQSFYNSIDPSQQQIASATNYFINKITNIKGNDAATRAAAMIPVSVNFKTDGISGFNMGQGFTIPDEMLPYTYSTRVIQGEKDHVNKVGFVVTGLSHTIENNTWDTNVKASMIFLKDASVYQTYKYKDKPVGRLQGSTEDPDKDENGNLAKWESGEIVGYEKPINYQGVVVLEGSYLKLKQMIDDAAKDNVILKINSAYRSYDDQLRLRKQNVVNKSKAGDLQYLKDASPNQFSPATGKPGFSNHQSGVAFDIQTGTPEGKKAYEWLVANAQKYDFIRTVASERWHWEYRKGKGKYSVVPDGPLWNYSGDLNDNTA